MKITDLELTPIATRREPRRLCHLVVNQDYPCDITGATLCHDCVVRERLRYEEGWLVVPDGPGLGVDVDEERLAACRRELTV